MKKSILPLYILLIFTAKSLDAQNIRNITMHDGLSSNCVKSICMDSDGFMWIGTGNGLNIYDGTALRKCNYLWQNSPMPGNMVKGIVQTDPGIVWLNTDRNLSRVNKAKMSSDNYFAGRSNGLLMTKTGSGELFVIASGDSICMYNRAMRSFSQIYAPNMNHKNILDFAVTDDHIAWIFSSDGNISRYKMTVKEEVLLSVKRLPDFEFGSGMRNVFCNGMKAVIIDRNDDLHLLDIAAQTILRVKNIASEIADAGAVTDAMDFNGDILVCMSLNGAFILSDIGDSSYGSKKLPIDCGVSSIYADQRQGIVILGTPNSGVYIYSSDHDPLRCFTSAINAPVGCMSFDKKKTLWVGTKGGGVILFKGFNEDSNNAETIKKAGSSLASDFVNAFCEGRNGGLWIAGDGPGINYYSYADEKLHLLEQPADTHPLINMRSIAQANDSTLWITSSGEGLYRVDIGFNKGNAKIRSVTNFRFFNDDNDYSSVALQNDSVMWVGCRQNGYVRMNTITGSFEKFKLKDGIVGTEPSEVFAIFIDRKNNLWLGSNMGLYLLPGCVKGEAKHKSFEYSGLPGNAIRAIGEDAKGRLWLGTDNGLARLDTQIDAVKWYSDNSCDGVNEFCNNALYYDPASNAIFAGGINGFVSVECKDMESKPFDARLHFTGLSIFGHQKVIGRYMVDNAGMTTVKLPCGSSYFTLSFAVPDYADAGNYTYHYRIGDGNEWIDNGRSTSIDFKDVSPGKYMLGVRFKNGKGVSSEEYKLQIVVQHPWYMTEKAYVIYALGAILIGGLMFVLRKKCGMRRRKTSKVNELTIQNNALDSKFALLVNVTKSFRGDLVAIEESCNRLLDSPCLTDGDREYIRLIDRDAKRIDCMIGNLDRYGNMLSNHVVLDSHNMAVEDAMREVLNSFTTTAAQHGVEYDLRLEDGLFWNTDWNYFSQMTAGLLYLAQNSATERITVEIYSRIPMLIMRIAYKGKEIDHALIPPDCSLSSVIDSFERNNGELSLSHDVMRIVVCRKIAELLGCDVRILKEADGRTIFEVRLPLQ